MEIVNHLENRLLFAVPKKGRLQETTLELLRGSDIQFNRGHRLDIALVKNLHVALVFLPAADIPTFVGEGRVDIGITGRDQVAEHDTSALNSQGPGWEELLDLEFGRCKLQVQVPEKGGISDVRDLIGKHVATSFVNLSRAFFADLERSQAVDGAPSEAPNETPNGIPSEARGETPDGAIKPDPRSTENNLRTKVIGLSGSVETACTLAVADGIVDLVESGETMKAAGLKAIGTVIESSAVLIKSRNSPHEKLVSLIAARIKGVIAAQKYVLCQYNIQHDHLETAVKITPGKRAPTTNALLIDGWVAVSVMVQKSYIATVMDQLVALGAKDVLVLSISNSRTD